MFFVPPPFILGATEVAVTGAASLSSTTDLTSYTFNDVAGLGAHSHVFLLISFAGGGGTISSVTVEGVTATAITTVANGSQRVAIYAVAESTAAPDIAVTLSAAPRNIVVGVVACTGVQSLTPVGTATSTSNTPSLNANSSDGGLALACALVVNGGTMTWNGVTEQYDSALEGTDTHSWGYSLTPTAETPRTIAPTYSVPWVPSAVSATFR